MHDLSDQQLIEILRERFEMNRKALYDLQGATRQLEKTNRKLQESEALKSHFLANIRNEINNPLTAILGWARQLGSGEADGQKVSAIARMIHDEAFNLDFQLQNIFIAAELEAGEAVPSYASLEVDRMIESIFDSLQEQAGGKGVCLKRIGPESFLFKTDARMLHAMLINLLVNAVEYSPEGGEVGVTVSSAEGRLKVAVENSGSGIAPECRDLVFDRFRQLDTGMTKSHRGHGLGLSITKALTELLGGTITLSSGKGEGCTFTLSLPEPEVDVDVLAEDGNLFLFT